MGGLQVGGGRRKEEQAGLASPACPLSLAAPYLPNLSRRSLGRPGSEAACVILNKVKRVKVEK